MVLREYAVDGRVEVLRGGASIAIGDDIDRLLMVEGGLVRSFAAQGVIDVADVHDARRERDLFADLATGIAAAVPAFMVVECDLGSHLQIQ